MSKKKKPNMNNVTLRDFAKWARKHHLHLSIGSGGPQATASEEPVKEQAKAKG